MASTLGFPHVIGDSKGSNKPKIVISLYPFMHVEAMLYKLQQKGKK